MLELTPGLRKLCLLGPCALVGMDCLSLGMVGFGIMVGLTAGKVELITFKSWRLTGRTGVGGIGTRLLSVRGSLSLVHSGK